MARTPNEQNGVDLDVADGGGVAVLTINRPSARNALSGAVIAQLGRILEQLAGDDSIRAVVLTGAAPGFCAGSDLKEIATMSVTELAAHEAQAGELVRSLAHLRMPVVAAVDGFAVGGGFLLAAGCDLIVTSSQAHWHLPEVSLGWIPPWGLQTLIARVGPVTARRLAWGDRPISGAELHAIGVADDIAESGSALDHATALADRLAALPAEAVSSTKRALSDSVAGSAENLDARTNRLFARDCTSDPAVATLTRFAPTTPPGRS